MATFGAWLDNADVLGPGEGWASIYMVYWRSAAFREVDAPVVDIAVGAAPRLQIGLSVPYVNVSDPGGTAARGFGDVYIHSKIGLVRPRADGVALAVSPALEILSESSRAAGLRRVNWLLPVSAHLDRGIVRLYGTGGYFSRGSIFGSGAFDARLAPRVGIVAALSHAYATEPRDASGAEDLGRRRTDLSGGAYTLISSATAVFGNLGRTFGPEEAGANGWFLSAGLTFGLASRARPPS